MKVYDIMEVLLSHLRSLFLFVALLVAFIPRIAPWRSMRNCGAFAIASCLVFVQLYACIAERPDIFRTALLAAVSAVVLGHAAFGALFIILFSAARNFSAFADRYKELSILKSYYTGSLPVLVGEEQTSLQDLKIGDTVTLEEGQYMFLLPKSSTNGLTRFLE